MIKNFKDKKTEEFFSGKAVEPFSGFKKAAERKLTMLDSATELRDLLAPPANRLEKLKGDRAGGSTAFASMTSGGFVLYGRKTDRMRSRLPIITRETARW